MKAVIYARYSSDSQREESIEGQLRECTAFAEKNGITAELPVSTRPVQDIHIAADEILIDLSLIHI